MNFNEILKSYRKIAILGTGKNSGKTVALNELISSASHMNIRLGLTSIGRDGEEKDIVTHTEKPSIYVPSQTLIATAEGCLKTSDLDVEIIDVTPFQTAIGRVVVCRARSGGYVQLAGPDTNKEIKLVSDNLLNLGAQTVLIDGALNRKTQGSPAIAEGVILSTGAVLSRSMERVVELTKHITKILTLSQADKRMLRVLEEAALSVCVSFIDRQGDIIKTPYKTALGNSSKIIEKIQDGYEYMVLPGTLMGSLLKSMKDDLVENKVKIVVRDGTRVFVEQEELRLFEKAGGKIEVIEPIRLLAMVVNPYSPEGYSFEPELFLHAMREAFSSLDVFDCMSGGI